jgi:hypothetical protein
VEWITYGRRALATDRSKEMGRQPGTGNGEVNVDESTRIADTLRTNPTPKMQNSSAILDDSTVFMLL